MQCTLSYLSDSSASAGGGGDASAKYSPMGELEVKYISVIQFSPACDHCVAGPVAAGGVCRLWLGKRELACSSGLVLIHKDLILHARGRPRRAGVWGTFGEAS